MRIIRILSILLLIGVSSFHSSFSQEPAKGTYFLLRVSSIDPNNPHVNFLSAYAYKSSEDSHPVAMYEQETPFEKKLAGTRFFGMFSDISGKNNIRVSLVKFIDGFKSDEVVGNGPLNILYADPKGIGYGWPSTFGNWSDFVHQIDSRNFKEE